LRLVWEDEYLLQSVSEGAMFSHAGMFGGYPAAAGYRHTMRDTNLAEVFANRDPYPIDDREPCDSEMRRRVAGQETLDKRATTMLEDFSRYDLFLYMIKGGPGLGDPISRLAGDVQRDLDDEVLTQTFAERVYGAVVHEEGGRLVVDTAATEARRAEIREERAQRAVPTREWIETERTRVQAKDMAEPVTDMYRSSFDVSPAWAAEYRAFWDLDEGFHF
jgi:N-methylhydantoinase B/acetone carboxylase alpha subunit